MLLTENRRSSMAFLVAVTTLFTLSVPLGLPAVANHPDGSCLDVENPNGQETQDNPTGSTHTVIATLKQVDDANPLLPECGEENAPAQDGPVVIHFEISGPNDPNDDGNGTSTPDRSCIIDQGKSSCVMPEYPGPRTGDDTIRGWISDEGPDIDEGQNESSEPIGDEPDGTDVVTKTWVGPSDAQPTTIDCVDENGNDTESNPSGTSESTETYTCTVRDQDGNVFQGADVYGENLNGANDPDNAENYTSKDYACRTSGGQPDTTDASGQCEVTVSQADGEDGEAIICFYVDPDDDLDPAEDKAICDSETAVEESQDNDANGADKVRIVWEDAPASGTTGLDAEPENDSNEIGQQHTITATVFNNAGSENFSDTTIKFEFFTGSPSDTDGNTPNNPDEECTTNGSSQCSISYTSQNTGLDRVCVWANAAPTMTGDNQNGSCGGEGQLDDDDAPNEPDSPVPFDDDVDVVLKEWRTTPGSTTATTLDCEPERDTNPTRTTHTVTCRATGTDGQPVGRAGIDAEATGANDPDDSDSPRSPDFSCTTSQDDPRTENVNEGGTCSFSHGPDGRGTTNETGTTTYRAWIDVDGSNSTAEADATEGRDENAQSGTLGEPDGTDVVEKLWKPGPEVITISPTSDEATVGECNPYTITLTDEQGAPVEGLIVDVEQRHSAAQDQQVDNEPTVSFCTPPQGSGPNRSSVDTSSGDLSSPQENPDNEGTVGGETVLPTDANGQVTIGIAVEPGQGSNGSGTVELSAFFDHNNDDDPNQEDPEATATKTWIAPAGSGGRTIDCLPNETTTSVSDTHTVVCVVEDASGDPEEGVSVTFTEDGPGDFITPTRVTTNSNGQASATVESNEAGEQTITGTITNSLQGEPDTDECERPAEDPVGAPAGNCADSVTNTWVDGNQNDRCPNQESDTRNHIVGTEGNDTIRGTEGDDVICGLGGDDLIDGLGGNDLIIGGSGNDSLRGGDGNDELKGNSGKDELRGNGGNDELRGGNQNDDLRGNAGDDVMRGQSGFDVLRGGSGDDEGHGGSGNDTIQGFTGNDLLVGNSGNDTMKGAGGRDEIRGGKNDDVISGGKGPDRIRGGPGKDVCAGGPGNDNIRGCER